jgi:hypothetical protein
MTVEIHDKLIALLADVDELICARRHGRRKQPNR